MIRKLKDELFALGFTLGASAITIMTLSGTVQNWALIFTFLSLALHLAGVLTKDGEDNGGRNND
jgi:hypothetical protein|tara:strand:+ start:3244 stop:3435 length:192 start_codon:yes stop_codon:yes gene_type:complete